MADSKGDLRKHFRELRSANPAHDDYTYLMEVPEIQKAKVITSYFPMSGEPNLISLNQALIKSGKTLLLPRVKKPNMEFAVFNGALKAVGKFNEPVGPIYLGQIDVVLTPATAIDRRGFRLGQGGGYYDKFLLTTSAFRIGIIHDREFIEEDLPNEWFDQKVHAVATESGLTRI